MGATGALQAGAMGVGAISSVGGAYSDSEAKKAQGIYQEGIDNVNARFADFQAEDAVVRGEQQATEISRKSVRDLSIVRRTGKQVEGAQRTSLSAQGIDIASGSAADILADTRREVFNDETEIKRAAELDVLTVKNNAWLEAWGYKAQEENYLSRGRMARTAGDSAARNSLLTGGLDAVAYGLRAGYYASGGKAGGGKRKF